MQIIAIASQKGGSGKTTLATHLAVQAEKMGAGPVGVIDTDPQGTLADWRKARHGESPHFATAGPQGLVRAIDTMRRDGVKLLFIDTPPAIGATIGRVIRLADVVVVPTRPSPNDLRAIGATVALVEGLGKPLVFLVNGAAPRARITAEAAVALSQHGPVVPAIVHQRVAYAASMTDGRTAMELPAGAKSGEEIATVWKYLKKRLAHEADPKRATSKAGTRRPAVQAGKKSKTARKSGASTAKRKRKPAKSQATKPKTMKPAVVRKRKKAAVVKAAKPRARRTRKVSAPLPKAA